MHTNEYPNLPWSQTPLKFIYHASVPTFGNSNTPHVSELSYRLASQTMKFESKGVAGYKQIIAHGNSGEDGVNLYSIDTGADGNILAGNYFTMNANHLAGKLHKMYIGTQIEQVKHSTLVLRPKSQLAQKN